MSAPASTYASAEGLCRTPPSDDDVYAMLMREFWSVLREPHYTDRAAARFTAALVAEHHDRAQMAAIDAADPAWNRCVRRWATKHRCDDCGGTLPDRCACGAALCGSCRRDPH